MLKEQVPFFGKGIIEKALNSFFRSYSKDTLEDEDGDQFFATPKIKIGSSGFSVGNPCQELAG